MLQGQINHLARIDIINWWDRKHESKEKILTGQARIKSKPYQVSVISILVIYIKNGQVNFEFYNLNSEIGILNSKLRNSKLSTKSWMLCLFSLFEKS